MIVFRRSGVQLAAVGLHYYLGLIALLWGWRV